MEDDFSFIASKMVQREVISEDEFNSLKYNITLNGLAAKVLQDSISVENDSINLDEIKMVRDSSLLLHE